MIDRQTSLSSNVISFCRYLRHHGYGVGIEEERDVMRSIRITNAFEDITKFEACLQAVLCRSSLEIEQFPELYTSYWRELEKALDSKVKDEEKPTQKSKGKSKEATFHELKSWMSGHRNKEEIAMSAYSDIAVNGTVDMPMVDSHQMREVFLLVKKLIEQLLKKRSRRYEPSHLQDKIDLRQTIRHNISRYEDIIKLKFRKKKKNKTKIVLLCDVSRSMEIYSRFFIQFMYAFQQQFSDVHAFVFSTELSYVQKALSEKTLNEGLQKIINEVHSWGGGTRIGQSFQQYIMEYGLRTLTRDTVVFILSDGWDTGEPEVIQESMATIHRKAMKTIWLNPLASSTTWTPEVVGMKAAMPYVDVLLPFHNIDTLRDVVKTIRW